MIICLLRRSWRMRDERWATLAGGCRDGEVKSVVRRRCSVSKIGIIYSVPIENPKNRHVFSSSSTLSLSFFVLLLALSPLSPLSPLFPSSRTRFPPSVPALVAEKFESLCAPATLAQPGLSLNDRIDRTFSIYDDMDMNNMGGHAEAPVRTSLTTHLLFI
jgi:hypothetical protein